MTQPTKSEVWQDRTSTAWRKGWSFDGNWACENYGERAQTRWRSIAKRVAAARELTPSLL